MGDLIIREIEQDEEFSDWLGDVLDEEVAAGGHTVVGEERYLVLANEIGDWIGGLRYSLRGGVAQLQDLAVVPDERHQGHGHRLLTAFEEHAARSGAHLIEFWTRDLRSEPILAALGWEVVLTRHQYFGGDTWHLLAKQLLADDLERPMGV